MTRLRVHCLSISLDGFGAGPNQDIDNPLGVGGPGLHNWMIPTRTFQGVEGKALGETGVDDDFVARGFANIGAWIMGRNMFGTVRRKWPNENWKGWWGDNPPYHAPVFVLTNNPRPSIAMEGGTTFHFVKGIHPALELAKDAARWWRWHDSSVPRNKANRRNAHRDQPDPSRCWRTSLQWHQHAGAGLSVCRACRHCQRIALHCKKAVRVICK